MWERCQSVALMNNLTTKFCFSCWKLMMLFWCVAVWPFLSKLTWHNSWGYISTGTLYTCLYFDCVLVHECEVSCFPCVALNVSALLVWHLLFNFCINDTVCILFCVCVCIFCFLYVFCVVFLCSCLLQYFDTVGWVFWPVKTVSHITYTVLEGT